MNTFPARRIPFKKNLLSLALGIGALTLSHFAQAQTCSGGSTIVTASNSPFTTDLVIVDDQYCLNILKNGIILLFTSTQSIENYSNGLSINNLGLITTPHGFGAIIIYNDLGSTITTLNNSGTISAAGGTGIRSQGTILNFTNDGILTVGNGGYGILNDGGSITNFNNSGVISASDYYGWAIYNGIGALIENFNNHGEISAPDDRATGIYNDGLIAVFINAGNIIGNREHAIYNDLGSITSLINTGTITANATSLGGSAIFNSSNGSIGTITNSGILSSASTGSTSIAILNNGAIESIVNNGLISSVVTGTSTQSYGVVSAGISLNTLVNNGTIFASSTSDDNYSVAWGISHSNSTLTTLINNGTITVSAVGLAGGFQAANGIELYGPVTTLTNNGTIATSVTGIDLGSSGAMDIFVDGFGQINTFNNVQGGNHSDASTSALKYLGALPSNYNIMIRNQDHYGQLSVTAPRGAMTFGIYDGTTPSIMTYTSVLSGINSSHLAGPTSGVFNYFGWTLNDVGGDVWDLVISFDISGTTGGVSIPSLTGSGEAVLGAQILTVAQATGIFSGDIKGTGGLTISGGTQTLTGVSTYTGATSISSGATLALSGAGSIATSNGVTANGTFDISATSNGANISSLAGSGSVILGAQTLRLTAASSSFGGSISGAGGLYIQGGTLVLTGANTYSGGTIVAAGTLQGSTTSLQGAIVNNSHVVFDQATQGTYSGVMSGTGSLTKQNAGTLILTGANTYSGGTTVSGGALQGNTTSLQGAIVNNSQVVFDQSTDGTYSGVMSGTGALTKQNVGTLILTGANTYSGGTTVAAGTLSVSGASPTGFGDVSVSSGATLMGTGTINGQLTVAGILKPGNSPGYLAATNTVTMNAGSTYLQDIAGTAQASSTSPVGAAGYYSFLNVTTGQFVIQPGTTLTPQLSNLFSVGQSGFGSAIYVPALGDRVRIITASGGISGRFSTLTQPAELATGTQFLPFYNMAGSNSIDLAVIPTSYQATIAAAPGNVNAQSVGGALTQLAQASLAGTAIAAQDQLLYAISGQTSALGIANLAQGMSGEVYAATVAVMAQTTQRTQQAVLNRLGDTAGLRLNMPMASSKAEAKSFANDNVWGELAYQRGKRASDSQSGGWGSNLYQLTFGSDFYSYNGMVAGAGFALSSTTINPTYGTSTIQQASLFAYGKMPVDSFVLDATASVGLSSSDIKRGDVTGLSAGFRNKSVLGNDVMVSLGLSRPFDAASVRLTPFARVTWQMVSQSSVNEGDAASALSVNRYTGNGVRGVIGLAAGSKANNPMAAKNTYRAYVGVGADSSGLLNPTLNASLAGIGTNITTQNAGTAFVQAGLYGTAKVSENSFAYAGISGEARSGQTLGTVNIGLSMRF